MRSNQKGFTLLTSLFALLVLGLASILLLHTIRYTSKISQISPYSEHDLDMAAHQLENELIGASTIQVTSQRLSFQLNSNVIQYYMSGNRLVRQVDNQGFEIVLLSISSVTFEKKEKVIKMSIRNSNGGLEEWLFINGIE